MGGRQGCKKYFLSGNQSFSQRICLMNCGIVIIKKCDKQALDFITIQNIPNHTDTDTDIRTFNTDGQNSYQYLLVSVSGIGGTLMLPLTSQ